MEHISSYLLKVEPGTPFARRGVEVPDEDEAAEQYLFAVEELGKRGYAQYEISNFAKPGREEPPQPAVLAVVRSTWAWGRGAHSFLEGRRFYYPRDLAGFLAGKPPAEDGRAGTSGSLPCSTCG